MKTQTSFLNFNPFSILTVFPLLKKSLIVLSLSLLFALSSSFNLILPFTPVPIVFTLPLIFFFSATLRMTAVYAVFLYLLEGIMGFPVFAGGNGGLVYVIGPTGGYLLGYALSSYLIAFLCSLYQSKKHSLTPTALFLIFALGSSVTYVFGVAYLGVYVGFDRALALGLYPFMGLELLKLLLISKGAALVGLKR